MMNSVYALYFERKYPDRDDTELRIGIYAPESDARAAIERLRHKSGFCGFPEGFEVYEWAISSTAWEEGFITKFEPILPSDLRMKDFDLPKFMKEHVVEEPPSNDR